MRSIASSTTVNASNAMPAASGFCTSEHTAFTLRHSHVAILIAQGAHPKTIQTRLGHSSISTTLDTYGHLFDGLDEAAADALDDVFAQFPRTSSLDTVASLPS